MKEFFDEYTVKACLEQIKKASVNFGGRELVIYDGMGKGEFVKELLDELGYPCSFFVKTLCKEKTFCGLPLHNRDILDVDKHYVLLATGAQAVKEYLNLHHFVEKDDRDCLEIGCSYYSCRWIEYMSLRGWGVLSERDNCLCFCCEKDKPYIRYSASESPEEIVHRLMNLRDQWIAESRKFNSNRPEEGRTLTSCCANCNAYQKGNWLTDKRFYSIELGLYPSPCQSKCFYCYDHIHGNTCWTNSSEVKAGYETFFSLIDYLINSGMTTDNLRWGVSPGEIAIHPYRDRIFKMIGNDAALFMTNAMKYDEQIAQKLHDDPTSKVRVSIDSGTEETWYKVKGVNNLNTTKENLRRYREMCSNSEQMELKYIVFPRVNDSEADYLGAISLLKELNLKKLMVTCDQWEKDTQEGRGCVIQSTARLFALCEQNGISPITDFSVFMFGLQEYEEIKRQAKLLL